MAKLKQVKDQDGDHLGYLIYCPGCRMEHLFHTEPWEMHDGKFDSGWNFDGDMEYPTFSPSLHINKDIKEERCHFILRNGIIDFFGDCFHRLKNTKVELPNHFKPSQFYLNKPIW